jgi:hypothetical protein
MLNHIFGVGVLADRTSSQTASATIIAAIKSSFFMQKPFVRARQRRATADTS